MKLWKTIKWLLHNPPTDIVVDTDPNRKCDYCDAKQGLWSRTGYTICNGCVKKVYDFVLIPKKATPHE